MDSVARGTRVIRLGPKFRWPGKRRVAVVFNVAYEAWSDGKAPGIGPMGNPLPPDTFDTNALSWGSYGSERGIERLLGVLERTKTRASVMVSGVLAERFPAIVRSIAEAGHEIVAHSYAQELVPGKLTPEDDRANIAKTTQLLASITKKKPRGWISPRGTPSPDTLRLLVEAGYDWQGDVFDDDRPYVQIVGDRRIVAIPLTMEINDLPHAVRFGRSPRAFIELYEDFLASSRKQEQAVMIDVTAHTHVYGRPSGAWAYEEIAKKVKKYKDVWVATRSEIADHVRKTVG
jgi:peptidoglycan/xylan/chitin deacetylase (PgdA/CDA1 family)